jgi:hypothetical protein
MPKVAAVATAAREPANQTRHMLHTFTVLRPHVARSLHVQPRPPDRASRRGSRPPPLWAPRAARRTCSSSPRRSAQPPCLPPLPGHSTRRRPRPHRPLRRPSPRSPPSPRLLPPSSSRRLRQLPTRGRRTSRLREAHHRPPGRRPLWRHPRPRLRFPHWRLSATVLPPRCRSGVATALAAPRTCRPCGPMRRQRSAPSLPAGASRWRRSGCRRVCWARRPSPMRWRGPASTWPASSCSKVGAFPWAAFHACPLPPQ